MGGKQSLRTVSLEFSPFSIQAFFWWLYGRGNWRVRKQRGLAAFPIMAKGILCVPEALVHVIRVTRSFAFWLWCHEHVFFSCIGRARQLEISAKLSASKPSKVILIAAIFSLISAQLTSPASPCSRILFPIPFRFRTLSHHPVDALKSLIPRDWATTSSALALIIRLRETGSRKRLWPVAKNGNKRDNFVFNYTILHGPSAFVITRQRKMLLFDGLGIFKSPVNCFLVNIEFLIWLTLNRVLSTWSSLKPRFCASSISCQTSAWGLLQPVAF